MNVEIGTEAAQFPEKEYIIGIFLAVYVFTWELALKDEPVALILLPQLGLPHEGGRGCVAHGAHAGGGRPRGASLLRRQGVEGHSNRRRAEDNSGELGDVIAASLKYTKIGYASRITVIKLNVQHLSALFFTHPFFFLLSYILFFLENLALQA